MNISGKYMKVWKKQEQNGFTKLDLGDSKKDKEGNYQNWTWFGCTLFGNAKSVDIIEGDVVEVKSGIISQRKYNDKWYNDIVIFEIEVQHKDSNSSNNSQPKSSKPDDSFDPPF